MSVYHFDNYYEYFRSELDSPRFGRGGRTLLAQHVGVEISFLSRVLSNKAEFNQEHLFRACEFFQLNETSKRYLLLLLHHSKAGSKELKYHYWQQIIKIKESQNKIKSKIQETSEMTEIEALNLFSNWKHILILMALRNKKYRNVESLTRYLQISNEAILKSLTLLENLGLVKRTENEWIMTGRRIHFSKYISAIRALHFNSRNMAIREFDNPNSRNLHYSLVFSADDEAVKTLRKMLLNLIETSEPIISNAKDEEILVLNLDLFNAIG